MEHRINSAVDAKNFILGGKATFTVKSVESGKHLTFRVNRKENSPFFVSIMTGPDNERSFSYLGCIYEGKNYRHGKKSKIDQLAVSNISFNWLWNHLTVGNLPDTVEFWHEGKCCRCGRKLTHPESLENGIGPECIKMIGGLK